LDIKNQQVNGMNSRPKGSSASIYGKVQGKRFLYPLPTELLTPKNKIHRKLQNLWGPRWLDGVELRENEPFIGIAQLEKVPIYKKEDQEKRTMMSLKSGQGSKKTTSF